LEPSATVANTFIYFFKKKGLFFKNKIKCDTRIGTLEPSATVANTCVEKKNSQKIIGTLEPSGTVVSTCVCSERRFRGFRKGSVWRLVQPNWRLVQPNWR